MGSKEASAKHYKELVAGLEQKITTQQKNEIQNNVDIHELKRQKEDAEREMSKAQSEVKGTERHLQSVKKELESRHEEIKSIKSGKDNKDSCIIS